MGVAAVVMIGAAVASAYMQEQSAAGTAATAKYQAGLQTSQAYLNKDIADQQAKVDTFNESMAEQAGQAQLQVGAINQIVSQRQALAAVAQANDQATQLKTQENMVQGAEVAGYSKANVEMDGTPALVLRQTAANAEHDIANVIQAGKMGQMNASVQGSLAEMAARVSAMDSGAAAYSYGVQATQAQQAGQAGLAMIPFYGYQAANLGSAAYLQAGGTIMSGIGGIAGSMYKNPYSKTG